MWLRFNCLQSGPRKILLLYISVAPAATNLRTSVRTYTYVQELNRLPIAVWQSRYRNAMLKLFILGCCFSTMQAVAASCYYMVGGKSSKNPAVCWAVLISLRTRKNSSSSHNAGGRFAHLADIRPQQQQQQQQHLCFGSSKQQKPVNSIFCAPNLRD